MDKKNTVDYDSTICTSKEASLAKAMEIMLEEINNKQVKQEIVRPKVSLIKGIILIIGYIGSLIASIAYADEFASLLSMRESTVLVFVFVLFFIILCFSMNRLLVWMILLYQRYAPERIRKSCCYEPSCSEYMKMAIKKYGVFKGVYKGVRRLQRCHWPNGGVDYP